MNLLRCLAYLCATKEFRIYATHISGVRNTLADALSRNNLPLFLSHYPQANQEATHIPAEVLDAVMLQEPDWTAKNWIARWNSTWTTLLAPTTKRTYGSAKKRYILFCHSHNIPPFPTSEPVLCRFVAHLANSSLKHTSN